MERDRKQLRRERMTLQSQLRKALDENAMEEVKTLRARLMDLDVFLGNVVVPKSTTDPINAPDFSQTIADKKLDAKYRFHKDIKPSQEEKFG